MPHKLVLPEAQISILHDLAAHVRQRTKVYEQWGFAAKSARGDVLNQIGHAMDDTRTALIQLEIQEGDGYAALDASVKAVSDKIEQDAKKAKERVQDLGHKVKD